MDDWDQLTNLGDCGALLEQHPLALVAPERVDRFVDAAIAWSVQTMSHYLLGIGPEPGPRPQL
jgi:hypothetical protein